MKKYCFNFILAIFLIFVLFLFTQNNPLSTTNFSKLVVGDSIENMSSNILQNYSTDLTDYFSNSNDEKQFIESGKYYSGCFVYSGSLSVENKTYNILLTIPVIVFSDGLNILLINNNSNFLSDDNISIFSGDDQYRRIVGKYSITFNENPSSNMIRVTEMYELSFHCDAVSMNDSSDRVEIKHTIISSISG